MLWTVRMSKTNTALALVELTETGGDYIQQIILTDWSECTVAQSLSKCLTSNPPQPLISVSAPHLSLL